MGQFSWITQDTRRPIFNDWDTYGDRQTIHMVDPRDGKDYKEEGYEGYGRFGGRDFYELLADINKDIILAENPNDEELKQIMSKKFEDLTEDDIDEKRSRGIDLWYGCIEPDTTVKKAKYDTLPKIVQWFSPILVENYEKWTWYNKPGCYPQSDPDQGWHNEEEEQEDEDWC